MPRPRIFRHSTAGWLLLMPGHDPIEADSWHAAVGLLVLLDERPAPVVRLVAGVPLRLPPEPEQPAPAVTPRGWRRVLGLVA